MTKQQRWHARNPWNELARNAKRRCEYPKARMFSRYGGRGIRYLLSTAEVKALWARDAGDRLARPSIDRVNPDGDYEFANVRFIELSENIAASNRRRMP